ncbi:MAG: tRNA (adenosine(37)-N6)-threonylcarbamoyltransferase complex transferase subunit TsaD [Elusimicrobia bacterium CG06_land_8_20_14_3_00_38_11]|nr:MAG: tRNA (adenosine(37)-N6)-threonylcarbamoyltransferase complex transferase subunit TsaD [Elusimicrobia bacterium CG06_land_8_20_14_3_00_38_11]
MTILGIETSCDDTSAAVVSNGTNVLSNVVSSQIKIHKKYGGIVPELASRQHLENINFVIEKAIRDAGCKIQNINAVAVTVGPGLIGSLLVGTTTAQAISNIMKIPVAGINHIEGHIFANFLQPQRTQRKTTENTEKVTPPFVALIVSGGHTDLLMVKNWGNYKILGRTRDDAVGEVFDKIAKFLGLDYPGGPIIDKLAKKGDNKKINFPRPYMPDSWDFSFSGLKTAVINYVNSKHLLAQPPTEVGGYNHSIADLCASFQQSCADVLVRKTVLACEKFNIKKIILGGGVSANSRLRCDFIKKCDEENIKLFMPAAIFCTDNAAMIASAGYFKLKKIARCMAINPSANLELKSWNRGDAEEKGEKVKEK